MRSPSPSSRPVMYQAERGEPGISPGLPPQGDYDSDDSHDSSSLPTTSKPFFPPAIVIKSTLAPHPAAPILYDPDAEESSPSSTLLPPPPKSVEWREWTINPAKHGPERLTRPPVFVQSKGLYDELGRSVLDGVQVDVDTGSTGKKKAVESGEQVADWYAALSRSASASAPQSGARTPPRQGQDEKDRKEGGVIRVGKDEAIDLTGDSDNDDKEDQAHPGDVPARGVNTPNTQIQREEIETTAKPLRVHQNEWFIRRALLKSHQASTRPAKPIKPSSIGSMLGTSPIHPQNHKPPPTYVLGPENKGYEILKDRLGWHGGGLGRPAGWTGRESTSPPPYVEAEGGASLNDLRAELERDVARSAGSRVKSEDAADTPIDLTAETDSASGSDLDDPLPDDHPSGPGRTAPIATSLKLDRLGLGHRRAQKDKQGNPLKRVTHTHQEIVEAQRRAKYRRPVEGLELGKKGKIKWKEKDKKEREERRRIAAALNAL
ncbi:hypothetical protein DB88DRAFT_497149 [Papiliotrema laurentii]|uniref:G-patch domain-containing protein n=1 Tax=Papiliotrema laurentii TaxID=5418 RepID=A0AAD9CVB0_PAPLA|nr:hypothetical protein DB88DRAFT_497149 [Papiliotrema laurentii]